jgi:hypothetical protein
MFARKITIECILEGGEAKPCPVAWIDSFAMRNFTNDKIFDDTLPLGDGRMEIGHRVPMERLECAMEEWFRKKGYVKVGERLIVQEETNDGAPE